jgi:hypothetical protein
MRIVENELKDPQLFLAACVALAFDDDMADESTDTPKRLRGLLQEIQNHPYWQDGKHMGDCIKQPNTCLRCLVEMYADEGKQILESVEKHDAATPTTAPQ